MAAPKNLIFDLEESIATKNIGRRAELLGRIADLFVSGSADFSSEQIALFDDVMSRLLVEIDETARAAFGQRLDAMPKAPPNSLHALALDDAITVSGPLLMNSKQLSEHTVVEAARTKSQQHLLAISKRQTLSANVTDVLVDRGDRNVTLSTATNQGAKFSEHGYSTLAKRAEADDDLAFSVLARSKVPRHHMLKLFVEASENVRRKLEAENPSKGKLLRNMIATASNKIQANVRERSPNYAMAYAQVHTLYHSSKLDEQQLAAFAEAGKFDETAIALALLCNLPIDLAERMMTHDHAEQIIVVSRAFGFSWATAKAILAFHVGADGFAASELNEYRETFEKLTPDTAKKALGFFRMRDRSAGKESVGLN